MKSFKLRRKVNRMEVDSMEVTGQKRENCQWSFNLEASNPSSGPVYTIFNKRYNKPLYSATFLYSSSRKRGIFLWHKSVAPEDEFKWSLECKNIEHE